MANGAVSEPDFITLPGVSCPCGSADLRVIVPGVAGEELPLFGWIRRPVADRGWCGIEHAREAGWPWLASERAAA
jgi:hypothetical protein